MKVPRCGVYKSVGGGGGDGELSVWLGSREVKAVSSFQGEGSSKQFSACFHR